MSEQQVRHTGGMNVYPQNLGFFVRAARALGNRIVVAAIIVAAGDVLGRVLG